METMTFHLWSTFQMPAKLEWARRSQEPNLGHPCGFSNSSTKTSLTASQGAQWQETKSKARWDSNINIPS